MSEMAILDQSGDTRLQWDKDDPDSVASAEARFNELKAKRFLAYTVNKKGTQGEVIQKFDPNAERIILTPPPVGG
jgi:hypothetical protein